MDSYHEHHTAEDLGERGLIELFCGMLEMPPGELAGPGDDCAVVRAGPDSPFDLVLTSDPVTAGVHFDPSTPPELVGHKAVARSLSDIAAMGARPEWALVDVVAPADARAAYLTELWSASVATARDHGLTIIGGDTSTGPVLSLHVFATGRLPRGTAVLRSTARAGDTVFVTGKLGGSREGRHLSFEPRVREGCWLREQGWATAMTDISDGLAVDLLHIANMSGTAARIVSDMLPVAACVAGTAHRSAVDHALYDGEDYELLFTVSGRRRAEFEKAWAVEFHLDATAVGEITAGTGLELVDGEGRAAPIDPDRGYEHFRREESPCPNEP